MRFLNRDDNALALTTASSKKIHFAYQARKYALLFGLFAIALSCVVWLFGEEIKNIHIYIYWFTFFLAAALCFGTINTFFTRCKLEIDATTKTVRYALSTLFGKTEWEKPISEFKDIRIYRPIAGPGAAGHATLRKVLLTSQEDEIPLVPKKLEINNVQSARRLAEDIASMMALNVIEE